jgi:hypothetical protein
VCPLFSLVRYKERWITLRHVCLLKTMVRWAYKNLQQECNIAGLRIHNALDALGPSLGIIKINK